MWNNLVQTWFVQTDLQFEVYIQRMKFYNSWEGGMLFLWNDGDDKRMKQVFWEKELGNGNMYTKKKKKKRKEKSGKGYSSYWEI